MITTNQKDSNLTGQNPTEVISTVQTHFRAFCFTREDIINVKFMLLCLLCFICSFLSVVGALVLLNCGVFGESKPSQVTKPKVNRPQKKTAFIAEWEPIVDSVSFHPIMSEPQGIVELSHKLLIEFIQKRLMPQLNSEDKETFSGRQWTDLYMRDELNARNFIRSVQIYDLMGQLGDTESRNKTFDELNYMAPEEVESRYLEYVAAVNESRKNEFDRIMRVSSMQKHSSLGKMSLEQLSEMGYERDNFSEQDWKRPLNFTLYSEKGPAPRDVYQMATGDCWLMSTMAALAAQQPDHIKNMIKDQGNGLYDVKLYFKGEFKTITVDCFFPAMKFTKSVNYWWPVVIEKAFAKYYNDPSYEELNAGTHEEAYHALTSYHCHWYDTTEGGHKLFLKDFSILRKHWNNGCAIGISLPEHACAVVGLSSRDGENYVHVCDPNNLKQVSHEQKWEWAVKFPFLDTSDAKNSILKVPFSQLSKVYTTVAVLEYGTGSLKTQRFESNNHGKPVPGHEVLTIRTNQATEITIKSNSVLNKPSRKSTNTKNGVLMVTTSKTGKRWYITRMTCGETFTLTVEPEFEYRFIPVNADPQETSAVEVLLTHSADKKITVTSGFVTEQDIEDADLSFMD